VLVECSHCGAPLDVSNQASIVRCSYCSHQKPRALDAHDRRAGARGVGAAAELGASERDRAAALPRAPKETGLRNVILLVVVVIVLTTVCPLLLMALLFLFGQ